MPSIIFVRNEMETELLDASIVQVLDAVLLVYGEMLFVSELPIFSDCLQNSADRSNT